MALPTASDVRAELEGYCLEGVVSDEFITSALEDEVVPYVESVIRTSVSGAKTVTEMYSGTGKDILILNRKNIQSITNIRLVSGNDIDTTINLASVVMVPGEGILKVKSGLSEYYNYRIFPKGNNNIQITYVTGGDCPADLSKAICFLTAVAVLDNIEGRSGGGQLSGQAYSRQYGNMGKFTNIRKRLSNRAHAILRRYSTGVVGA